MIDEKQIGETIPVTKRLKIDGLSLSVRWQIRSGIAIA